MAIDESELSRKANISKTHIEEGNVSASSSRRNSDAQSSQSTNDLSNLPIPDHSRQASRELVINHPIFDDFKAFEERLKQKKGYEEYYSLLERLRQNVGHEGIEKILKETERNANALVLCLKGVIYYIKCSSYDISIKEKQEFRENAEKFWKKAQYAREDGAPARKSRQRPGTYQLRGNADADYFLGLFFPTSEEKRLERWVRAAQAGHPEALVKILEEIKDGQNRIIANKILSPDFYTGNTYSRYLKVVMDKAKKEHQDMEDLMEKNWRLIETWIKYGLNKANEEANNVKYEGERRFEALEHVNEEKFRLALAIGRWLRKAPVYNSKLGEIIKNWVQQDVYALGKELAIPFRLSFPSALQGEKGEQEKDRKELLNLYALEQKIEKMKEEIERIQTEATAEKKQFEGWVQWFKNHCEQLKSDHDRYKKDAEQKINDYKKISESTQQANRALINQTKILPRNIPQGCLF